MAKRKNSAALFEVIGKGGSKGLQAPSWIKPGEAPGAGERPSTPLKQPPGLDGAGDAPAPQAPPMAAPVAANVEPIAAVVDGRIRLNLGYVSCVAISLGLIVLLAGVYKLGQRSGSSSSGATQAGPPTMFVDGGDSTPGSYGFEKAQALADEKMPDVGRDLLIIEQNIDSLEDAKAIQKYLWSKGLTTYVIDNQTGWIGVVDTVNVSNMTDEGLAAYTDSLATWGRDPQWLLGSRYTFDQPKREPRMK